MNPVYLPCVTCGEKVEVDPAFLIGQKAMCERCVEREAKRARIRVFMSQLEAQWGKLCPQQFTDTRVELLPCPKPSAKALEWDPGQDGTGINLWGEPNTGKTRSLFLRLRKDFMAGKTVVVFLAGQFEAQLQARAWKRKPWLEHLSSVDLLAFDDFDKGVPMSSDHEKILFSLLDHRMANKKPVLLTHNSRAQQLEYKFRNGEAMVRRIRDFTQSVYFKRNDTATK